MPKRKKYYIDIPKLLLYDTLDKLMFGYVMCGRRTLPSASLKMLVEAFMEDYNLCEDDYPVEQALQTWYRMFDSYRKEWRKLDF